MPIHTHTCIHIYVRMYRTAALSHWVESEERGRGGGGAAAGKGEGAGEGTRGGGSAGEVYTAILLRLPTCVTAASPHVGAGGSD